MKAFLTVLGPVITITETGFLVEMGESSDKKYFADPSLVDKNGDYIPRGEADILFLLYKLRVFLEQFR